MDRRRFIISSGTVGIGVLAGCTDDEGESTAESNQENQGDGPDTPDSTERPQQVDPTVTDLRHPEPQGVSTDDESLGDNRHQFSVTVENTGAEGNIDMTLVLLEDQETSIWSSQAEEAGSYSRYFSEGERRTETYSTELNGQYEGFGFRLIPAEAEVDVRNDGGSGEVEVRLVQQGGLADGAIIENKNLELESGSTTVSFAIDASFALERDIEEIQLKAEVLTV